MKNKLPDLPASNDKEFWEDAEVMHHQPVYQKLCKTHFYTQNGNAASCTQCPFGVILPGYMRVFQGKLIDLRDLSEK